MAIVRKLLMDEIEKQANSEKSNKKANKSDPYKFDPESFWKCQELKKLEDTIKDIFGFRSVQIQPFIEKYKSKKDEFESTMINCFTYFVDRYPIDGLVTDDGFYDKTHSINMDLRITLGLIKLLEPDELTAVLLHEFGHNIDPAMVSIEYAQTNILSKYLTDRKKSLSKAEKKLVENNKHVKGFMTYTITSMLIAAGVVLSFIAAIGMVISSIVKGMSKNIGASKGRINDSLAGKLKKIIKDDAKSDFGRREFSEAFADNFARMYGYGPQLGRAFVKMSLKLSETINSRFSREKDRQRCIMLMISQSLKDEHKTDVHRIKSLIREYYEDINDPNVPKQVKDQLRDDVKEVEKVLDMYMNSFSEFQNNIYRMISEEIDAVHPLSKSETQEDNKQNDIKESAVQRLIYFDESKKAYERLKKLKETLTPSEREEVKKMFGQSTQCSFARDKDGYFCYTHRCRSRSYPTIADIPQKDVDFIRSTS